MPFNKFRLLRIIIFLLSIASFWEVGAQRYRVDVDFYTAAEGLASDVYDLAKDENGALWLTTKRGLVRFDGKKFKEYNLKHGLSRMPIGAKLHLTPTHVWVLHREINANNYVREIDIFEIFSEKAIPIQTFFKDKLPFGWNEIKHIETWNHTVYFELLDNRAFYYKYETGFREAYPVFTEDTLTLFPHAVHYDNTSVRKERHLQLYLKDDFEATKHIPVASKNYSEREFRALKNKEGQYFLAQSRRITYNNYESMLYRIDAKGNQKPLWSERGHERFRIIYVPNMRAFWCYSKQGAKLINEAGEVVYEWNAPPNFVLGDVARVEGSTVWQQLHNGFIVFSISQNHFINLYGGISFRGINRIDSTLFFAHEYAVLARQPSGRTYKVLPTGLFNFVDEKDKLWTANKGKIYTYEPKTKETTFEHFSDGQLNEIWSIYKLPNGRLLISQSGVINYDPVSEDRFPIAYNAFPELQYHTVYHFYQKSKNTLWLCATSGLYEMDLQKGITARYWSGGKGKYYLPTDDFRHLYFDKKTQTYWLATGNDGLIEWQPQNDFSRKYTFHEGISNIVHGVYADDFGFLWLSTEGGLVQFERSTKAFRIYTTADGLMENEFNRISHFQDTDGTLYFGSINGITVFHPKHFKNTFLEQHKATPFVLEIQQYSGDENKEVLVTKDFFQKGYIALQPNDRYFKLLLGIKEENIAAKTKYFYKIEDVDKNWTELDENEIMLGRLPFGHQQITVKVLLPDGRFSESILTIPVKVYRPFYLTIWFVLLAIATIAGIFYALYRYRIAQFERRQRLRTRIASDLHDDVGSLLSRLAMQAEMIKYVSKERGEAIIKDIINTSRTSIDTMRDIIWAIDARNDTTADVFLRMEEQLEEMLTPAGISYEINTRKVTNTQPLHPEYRQNIFFIFKEAITNTVKHSDAVGVFVEVIYDKKEFKITIQEELTENKNETVPFSTQRPRLTSQKTGSGVKNMQLRAERIGATLTIQKNNGYLITLTLELKNSRFSNFIL